jgi:protease II
MGGNPGLSPPVARVDMVRDTHFGATLEDPYRWMEQEGEEFQCWPEGQAASARSVLDVLPRRASLLARRHALPRRPVDRWDERPAGPVWEPAKLAARLQAATISGRPVLLRVKPHGGHGIGSTRDQERALLADELVFLLHAFGLDDAA